MGDTVKTVYASLMPLIATPYIMYVIHKEGQEPRRYLEEMYYSRIGLMWFVRIFMMVVMSALSSIAAILVMGAIALIASSF